MKNIYTILGVLGILLVGAGAYFIGGVSPFFPNEQSLIEFVPGELGQVLVLDADEDLKQVAIATNSFDSEQFAKTFDSIEQVIVYQNDQQSEPINLLFIQGDETFDIAALEELGLVAEGEDYSARELGDAMVVYSDTAGLAWYDSHPTRLTDQSVTDQFLEKFDQGNYNAGFFSTAQGVEDLGGYSALVAGNLESTYLLSSLNATSPQGELILQMKEGTISPSQAAFEPMLQNYYGESLFYFELQAFKDFLGIDESQIQTFLPFIAGSAGIPLPSPDGITELLGENIALVLNPSPTSPLGIQASLIVHGTQHFQTLQVFYPILENLVTQNLPLISSGSTLETITTETSISSVLPVGEGASLPMLSLSTDDETTQLTILGTLLAPGTSEGITPLKNDAVAVFGRDSSLLGQLVGGALPTGVESGTLDGSVTVDDNLDQIVIHFLQVPTSEDTSN